MNVGVAAHRNGVSTPNLREHAYNNSNFFQNFDVKERPMQEELSATHVVFGSAGEGADGPHSPKRRDTSSTYSVSNTYTPAKIYRYAKRMHETNCAAILTPDTGLRV